jgi:hypothetical protein
VGPFEFIIAFLSFIYALALTHLLFAWTRMIRHRRQLVLSWPHLLWMLAALFNLGANWISGWDFRGVKSLSIAAIVAIFTLVIINYFVCALVSPEFEDGETYDMKRFHECEGTTYIGAFLVLIIASILANLFAGAMLSVTNWWNENGLVSAMLAPPIAALLIKRHWMQVLAPAVELALAVAYAVIYYPVLASSG